MKHTNSKATVVGVASKATSGNFDSTASVQLELEKYIDEHADCNTSNASGYLLTQL